MRLSAKQSTTRMSHRKEWWQTLCNHSPEYLMEAWGLGMFMVSAAVFTTLFEYPGSPVHQALVDADIRRALIGLAMGLTAVGIIYSPWGQQSGAHLNPAVTLTFLRLGKITVVDAAMYITAQFMGGLVGVLLSIRILGVAFVMPPVQYIVTLPGAGGVATAFLAELVISAAMMFTVLLISNSNRFGHITGLCAGALVALYITFEAPLSGMSMNPARSFASAAPGGMWEHLWLYFTAPVLGMLVGAELYCLLKSTAQVRCAKLDHSPTRRCIHCHYEAPDSSRQEA